MASQAYQIGQYRFGGAGCVTAVNSTLGYEAVTMGDSSSATSFQDLVIKPDSQFLLNQDYYLFLKIPQDMNYDLAFNIKLVKGEDTVAATEFQFLKAVSVLRGGTGENAHQVALYEKSTGAIAAMIPLAYKSGKSNTKDLLYWDKANDIFYLGKGGTAYTRTTKVNDMSMIASWKQEVGDNFGVFELTFRPMEMGFTKVVISLSRDATDYNIQRVNEDGSVEYGRKIDINKVDYELFKISNLVDHMNKDKALSRIGVWGHPGLLMCINGEEIRIGPSGFYELDAIPITSIGVVAKDGDYNSNFTIDYTYANTDLETN